MSKRQSARKKLSAAWREYLSDPERAKLGRGKRGKTAIFSSDGDQRKCTIPIFLEQSGYWLKKFKPGTILCVCPHYLSSPDVP